MSSISSASASKSVNLKKFNIKKCFFKAWHVAVKYARHSVKQKTKKLSLNQNNTNITHFCQGGIHFCQGGIHFCHGGIHFCQGGIQKALFRLARLCNLCSKHGHPLRVRSPKRVALPMLHVK